MNDIPKHTRQIAPREPLGAAPTSSGTTGRGEAADAADGRTETFVADNALGDSTLWLKNGDQGVRPLAVIHDFDLPHQAKHLWPLVPQAEVERLTRECGDLRERIRIAMSALSVASARAVNAEAERDDWRRTTHDVRQALARTEAKCDGLLAMKARVEALAPLRAVIDRALADVDAGHRNNAVAGLISADVILREIEGES